MYAPIEWIRLVLNLTHFKRQNIKSSKDQRIKELMDSETLCEQFKFYQRIP